MNKIVSDLAFLADKVVLSVGIMERDRYLAFPQEHLDHQNYLVTNDETDENIGLTEPIDFDYSNDESLEDDINYDLAMDAYSATSDSDVGSPYELERMSRCVS